MRATPLLLLLAACSPPSFETDSGQLTVSDTEVVDIEGEGGGPSPFLAGTSLCPRLDCPGEMCPKDEAELLACFEQSFTGPVVVGECLSFTEPGVVDWTFTALECPSVNEGWAPLDDHVAIEILAPEAVEGWLAMPLEEAIEASSSAIEITVDRPEDWRYADGDTWQLAAGEPFILTPRLRTVEGAVPVAWRDGVLTGSDGVDVSNGEGIGRARVVLDDGQTADLTLEVGGSSLAVGAARGVAAETITSLELAVLTVSVAEGLSAPYAARAVARDADGNLVLGAPVTWRIHGLLATPGPDASYPGADYVGFSDACADPAKAFGEQRATLTASIGLLSASKQLVWTPRLEAAPVEGWTPDPECQGACGCATGGDGVVGGMALLVAAALIRRRA